MQYLLMRFIDLLFGLWPQRRPLRERLSACRIIAHRGAWDNVDILENTPPAFDRAAECGAWGLELDYRWTADLVPVVIHDPTAARVFGKPVRVCEVTADELRASLPLVPTLAEVVARYGGKQHLMIEIKDDPYPDPETQYRILEETLAPLKAIDDYHFLALDPDLFRHVPFATRATCIPVAELNIHRLSRVALERELGGLFGHFLLLTNAMKQRHEVAGQRIGTGFPASRNVLYRELNRGVDWIFTNHPVHLQQIVNRALEERS